MEYAKEIAKNALTIGAIKLNPDNPFEWASGYRMPIYNDNRMFLSHPKLRNVVIDGFRELIEQENIPYGVIAGTSTAGIAPGAILADRLYAPFIYIRDKPKAHGLCNQIEGIDAESDLDGLQTIVIEDLISTGGSSARAVQAVRDAKGSVSHCLAIFDYGLRNAVDAFGKLSEPCTVYSLTTYDALIDVAKEFKYLNEGQVTMLNQWRLDPFNWGEKNGFPKIEK